MTSSASEPILVTSALPYANGSIHIGHLVEYIWSSHTEGRSPMTLAGGLQSNKNLPRER